MADSIIPQILEMDSPNVHVHSLVISPNLEAMLEHEERQRAAAYNGGFPPGLPPPPRSRPGTTESRNATLGTTELKKRGSLRITDNMGSGPPHMRNPYINPAPFVPVKSPRLLTTPLPCDESPEFKDEDRPNTPSGQDIQRHTEPITPPSDEHLWQEPVTWKTLDLELADRNEVPPSTETNGNLTGIHSESAARDDVALKRRSFDPSTVLFSGRLPKLLTFSSIRGSLLFHHVWCAV
jgi:hypothetical protein